MSQANGNNSKPHRVRNTHYYINGGDLYLSANNQLFRVHRYFFERESPMFRNRINSPGSSGVESHNGDSESSPIILDPVPAEDLENFLSIFYNPRYSLYDLTIDDWTTVLELAHQWGFSQVKDLVIRELQNQELGIIERIVLYQRYNMDPSLLIPLYSVLCSRDEPPDEDESEVLGIKTAVLIYRARERLRAQPSDGGRSPLPAGLDAEDVQNTLTGMLGITPAPSPTERKQGKNGLNGDDSKKKSNPGPEKNSNGRTGRKVGNGQGAV